MCIRDRLEGDGHVMLKLRAVGDVQVGEEHRVPPMQELEHRLHLGRVGLRVVAVQVQVL